MKNLKVLLFLFLFPFSPLLQVMTRKAPLIFFELLLCLFGACTVLVMQMERVQTTPYMDEIFHIPQTQKYCASKFGEWDPKITTPPGLYLVAYLVLQAAAAITHVDLSLLCVPFWLRIVNAVFSALNFAAIYCILRQRRQTVLVVYEAFCVNLLPVHFFFSMLFYTDQGSLFFVLAAILAHAWRQRLASSVLGFVAVTFRQTNVVWLGLLLLVEAESRLMAALEKKEEDVDFAAISPPRLLLLLLSRPLLLLRVAFTTLLRNLHISYIFLLFVAFVVANEGIVLGDRSAHAITLHLPQLLYFAAFCTGLAAPEALRWSRLRAFLVAVTASWRHAVGWAVVWALCLVAVHFFTYEHPYLLADNRHYTFYLWQRLFQRDWRVKYALTPAYLYCLHFWWSSLDVSFLLKSALLLCTAACLVPSPLLEFRYFVVPFVLWRVLSRQRAVWVVICETALFLAINAITLNLFFFKTITWPSEPKAVQRFMW